MRFRWAVTVWLLTLTVAGCTMASERAEITAFFSASRLRDLTALGDFSTVVFEPGVDGVVTTFDVLAMQSTEATGGPVVAKEITVEAPVRLPNGETVAKRLVVSMRKGLPGRQGHRWGGWTITAITAGPPAPSTRPR